MGAQKYVGFYRRIAQVEETVAQADFFARVFGLAYFKRQGARRLALNNDSFRVNLHGPGINFLVDSFRVPPFHGA